MPVVKLNAPAARAIREKTGLSVSETAKRLGVSQGQVSNWEAGRRQPTEQNLLALAGLLAVSLAAITIPDAA